MFSIFTNSDNTYSHVKGTSVFFSKNGNMWREISHVGGAPYLEIPMFLITLLTSLALAQSTTSSVTNINKLWSVRS